MKQLLLLFISCRFGFYIPFIFISKCLLKLLKITHSELGDVGGVDPLLGWGTLSGQISVSVSALLIDR